MSRLAFLASLLAMYSGFSPTPNRGQSLHPLAGHDSHRNFPVFITLAFDAGFFSLLAVPTIPVSCNGGLVQNVRRAGPGFLREGSRSREEKTANKFLSCASHAR